MRSRTLVAAAGIAMMAVAGCSTSITGQPAPQGAAGSDSGGGSAQIASVADLGAVVQHNADAKDSVHFDSSIGMSGEGAITATGDMKFGNGQASARMAMTMPGLGDIQMVLLGTAMYMKLPADLLSELGQSDKPWVKVPLDGVTASALGSSVDLAGEMDPTHMIDEIKSAGTIKQVSHQELNGVSTTHYSIDVDVAKLAQSMTDNEAEKQALSTVTTQTIPFDVWVDGANLPVKIVTNMFYSITPGSKATQMTTTTNYSNWGEQVSITAPPADQVGTMGG